MNFYTWKRNFAFSQLIFLSDFCLNSFFTNIFFVLFNHLNHKWNNLHKPLKFQSLDENDVASPKIEP